MAEPRWLRVARKYIGEREWPGEKTNPLILKWWTLIRAGFTDDLTPWCAAFVGGVLEDCKIRSSRSAAARSYENWGIPLAEPVIGCICVFTRGTANGHVGFFTGFDARGNILVLGGNQGNAVSIMAYPVSRLLGYRWPTGEPLPAQERPRPKPVPHDDPAPVPAPRPKPVPAPIEPPDVEPPVKEDEPTTFAGWIKHWANAVGTAVASFVTALMMGDWRAVTAVVAAGVVIFAIIWFTHMRRK